MDFTTVDGLLWLMGVLLPFIFLQRRLHFELQAVLLLLLRRQEVALGLFSFLFLPGVLLHEASHYVAATLLGVRTGRFSLLPRLMPGGKLQLGYVETEQTDFFRDAVIGAAPLITGGLAIAFIGLDRLGLLPLVNAVAAGNANAFWATLGSLPSRPDFWLWFYLAFAVSTTMLPSPSDRRGWLPLGLTIGGLVALALLAGAGPWMLSNLAPLLNRGMRALAAVFGVSLAIHLVLVVPLRFLRGALSKLTGLSVLAD